jgi:flagellar basal-body rod protein FlgG
MKAQELAVDNIAHNLANANTTGFKSRQIQFQDLLYQTMLQPGSAASSQSVIPTACKSDWARVQPNEINSRRLTCQYVEPA